MVGAVIIPFVCNEDTIVHRVSADTTLTWIHNHTGDWVSLLTQCGQYLTGKMKPEGSVMITCVACLGRTDVREAVEDS